MPLVRLSLAYVCMQLNSLTLGRHGSDFKSIFFKLIIHNINFSTHCEIVLSWMLQNTFKKESKLVQVMAWCLMAPSHYLSLCWHRSMSPYGITRPQWVNIMGTPTEILENQISTSIVNSSYNTVRYNTEQHTTRQWTVNHGSDWAH